VRAILLDAGEEALPAIAGMGKMALLDDAAEVGAALLYRLDATVAARVEHELGGAGEAGGLGGGEAKVHLEGDPLMRVFRPGVATEVVLAGGDENSGGLPGDTIVERCLPAMLGGAGEGLDSATVFDADAGFAGAGEQCGLEGLARQRGCRKGQHCFGGASGGGEPDAMDGDGAKGGGVNAKGVEVCKGFAREELAADLVAGRGFAFDQGDSDAFAGEGDCSGTACHATPEDEDFFSQRLAPAALDAASSCRHPGLGLLDGPTSVWKSTRGASWGSWVAMGRWGVRASGGRGRRGGWKRG
jgi:hypothetical protein